MRIEGAGNRWKLIPETDAEADVCRVFVDRGAVAYRDSTEIEAWPDAVLVVDLDRNDRAVLATAG